MKTNCMMWAWLSAMLILLQGTTLLAAQQDEKPAATQPSDATQPTLVGKTITIDGQRFVIQPDGSQVREEAAKDDKILRNIRVAVFDFDVLKGVDMEPAALTGQVNTMLAAMDKVTIVNRDQIKKVADEHKMALAGLVDGASAAQLGKFLSANYVIVGRASKIGQTNYLVLKMIDVATTVQTTVSAKAAA